MKKTISAFLFLCLFFSSKLLLAQLPNCSINPSTIIYIQTGSTIYNYDVTQPISATNPVINTITMPSGGGGLAVANNLNGPGPSPTFYTSVSGNWWYYDGTTWVNTGHSCGSTAAVNSGGGGNFIYNLVGSSGQVYQYDGTANSTLLLTVPGFSGGGPYDLVGNCDGGFYILRTNTGSWLRKYTSTGALAQSWTTTGSASSAGGGFAMVNNQVYYHNTSGFRSAPFSNTLTNLSFANVGVTVPNPSDMACCRICDSLVNLTPPDADFGMSNDTICAGDLVNFTDMSTDTPTIWNWNFPTGTPPTSVLQNPSNIQFNTPGLHSIRLIASNAGGSDTLLKPLYVAAVPTASITGDSSICGGQSATLTASMAGSPSYLWSNNATTPSITVTPSVTTTYSLVVSNGTCTDTATFIVNVVPQPVANIVGPTEICIGASSNLIAQPAGVSYTWNTSATSQTINPSPTSTTTYSVVVANGSCIDSATHTVAVNPLPVVAVVPTLTNCNVDNGTIATVVTSGTPNYSYLWSNSQTGSTATNLGAGNYTVIVTDSKNCVASAMTAVAMHPDPIASINPYPTLSVRIGESKQLTASGGVSYNWSPADFLSCTQCPDPIVTPKVESTVYCVDVTNQFGCTDTACVQVIVDTSCSNIFVPNAFTPNGDDLNDYITIKNTCAIENLRFAIFNRWGQKVFETNDILKQWDGKFEGVAQPTSTFFYYLHAKLINGRIIHKRGDITLIR